MKTFKILLILILYSNSTFSQNSIYEMMLRHYINNQSSGFYYDMGNSKRNEHFNLDEKTKQPFFEKYLFYVSSKAYNLNIQDLKYWILPLFKNVKIFYKDFDNDFTYFDKNKPVLIDRFNSISFVDSEKLVNKILTSRTIGDTIFRFAKVMFSNPLANNQYLFTTLKIRYEDNKVIRTYVFLFKNKNYRREKEKQWNIYDVKSFTD